jgi:hypothetical protein
MDEVRRSDLIDIEVWVHRETDKALLVSLPADGAVFVWVPRSQVEVFSVTQGRGGVYAAELTMPEWLAMERGLI